MQKSETQRYTRTTLRSSVLGRKAIHTLCCNESETPNGLYFDPDGSVNGAQVSSTVASRPATISARFFRATSPNGCPFSGKLIPARCTRCACFLVRMEMVSTSATMMTLPDRDLARGADLQDKQQYQYSRPFRPRAEHFYLPDPQVFDWVGRASPIPPTYRKVADAFNALA